MQLLKKFWHRSTTSNIILEPKQIRHNKTKRKLTVSDYGISPHVGLV